MLHFICFKNELHEAISKVANCTIIRTTMPFLEMIRFRIKGKTLELTGFNLDYGIRTEITIEGDDDQTGEFLILPRLISESVRKMDGSKITVDVDDKYIVEIKDGITELTISAKNAAEYPELPEVAEEKAIKIKENSLKSMIRQTKYATSNNEMKPVMMGELFEIEDSTLHIAAVDGYRLSICREDITAYKDDKFIIHKKAISLIDAYLKDDCEDEIYIFTNGKHACFIIHGSRFIIRLMEGVFHNYKASIPKSYNTEVIVDAKKLVHALERCDLLIDDRNKSPIRCSFEDNNLNIRCETVVGKIDDNVPIEKTGPDINIGFNNQYILEAARYCDCEKVRVQLTSDRSVVQMLPLEGDSFRFLLMPIRIKDR